MRTAGISVLACAAVLGTSASSAFAAAAMNIPAAALTAPPPDGHGPFYPITDNSGNPLPLPSSGKGVDVVGCSNFTFLFNDNIGFAFSSGNAVLYRIGSNGPNGGNAEGTGVLVDGVTATSYQGHLHVWFGQNVNPNYSPDGNQQEYFGETMSFSGTALNGSTIQVNGSGGGGSSASGNPTGWGHIKVTCTGTPATSG